jgi:nicotinamidase-related amidase
MAAHVPKALDDVVHPASTALLVIDVQNDLCHQACQSMLPTLRGLIGAARTAGVHVMYIQNTELPSGRSQSPVQAARRLKAGRRPVVTVEGTPGHDFVAAIAPEPTDTIIRKHRMNCFEGTDLDLLLRTSGIETVIITGVATQGCVLSTAAVAVSKDYYTVVVDDCSASWDPSLHADAIRLLGAIAHHVVPAKRLQAAWAEATPTEARFEEVTV